MFNNYDNDDNHDYYTNPDEAVNKFLYGDAYRPYMKYIYDDNSFDSLWELLGALIVVLSIGTFIKMFFKYMVALAAIIIVFHIGKKIYKNRHKAKIERLMKTIDIRCVRTYNFKDTEDWIKDEYSYYYGDRLIARAFNLVVGWDLRVDKDFSPAYKDTNGMKGDMHSWIGDAQVRLENLTAEDFFLLELKRWLAENYKMSMKKLNSTKNKD